MATIRRCIEYYLNSSAGLSQSAKDNFVLLISKLGDVGETELEDVNPAIIRLWLNELDLKESSKFLHYTNLKSALTRYTRDHKIQLDFSDLVGLVKAPKPSPDDIKMLTLDQVKEIMELTIEDKDLRYFRDIFIFMCFTGLSVSDMAKFNKSWLYPVENSKFPFWIKYKRTKRGAFSIVPVLPVVADIIERYPDWPIKYAGVRSIKHYCTPLSKLVGYHLNPHLARKTCGSLFLRFGMSLESVSKVLGHSNLALTARYYSVVTAAKMEMESGRFSEMVINLR